MFLMIGPRKEGQWGTGIWMGLVACSSEVYEGTPEGVARRQGYS